MFCTKCGVQMDENAFYCSQCGARTGKTRPYVPAQTKQLMRSRYNKKIAGVCGGVAEYLDVDPTVVRIVWLALAFLPFPGAILAYIIAWIVMPKEPLRIPEGGPYVTAQPTQA